MKENDKLSDIPREELIKILEAKKREMEEEKVNQASLEEVIEPKQQEEVEQVTNNDNDIEQVEPAKTKIVEPMENKTLEKEEIVNQVSPEVVEPKQQEEVINNNNDIEQVKLEENKLYDEVQPKFEEVNIKTKPIRTDSYFDGGLLELIAWKLLSFIIMIFTIGIAKPWGDVLLIRYELEHTVLNGKRLKFKGTGGGLFIERFKWIFFSIITLGIYLFFVPVKKYKWILSNVYFEDEEAVKGESYFDGNTFSLIGINILCSIINILSLGLFFTFTQCFKIRWLAKHTIINRKKIIFDGKALGLFGKYILWLFLTIITLGIYAFWLGIKMTKWEVKHTHIKVQGEEYKKDKTIIGLLIAFIVLIIIAVNVIPTFITGLNLSEGFEQPNETVPYVNSVNYNYNNL